MGQWPSPVTVTVADHELLTSQIALLVTITTPTEGATVTSSAIPVQWSFAPGTQATLRVRVWADAALTDLVYDSGVVPSGTKAHTIPAGTLATAATFYLKVDVTTTDGQAGASAVRTFLTAYAPGNAFAAPTIQVLGADCDAPGELPGVRYRWTPYVLAANETFTRYSIWRRIRDGSGAPWVRIASDASALSAATYVDRNPPLWVECEYDVTVDVHNTSTGADLSSPHPTHPPRATIENDFTFIHRVDAPSSFVEFFHFAGQVEPVQETAEDLFWGAAAPVVFINPDASYRRVTLEGLPDLRRGALWAEVEALRDAQRTAGAVLCLRIGVERVRVFCAVRVARYQLEEMQYVPTLELVEVPYSEAVA